MEQAGLIKVLIVEDSPLVCKVLTEILEADPGILVIASAANGKEAFEITARLKPDLITMDIHLPVIDGVEAVKQIMAYHPTPILIISSSTLKDSTGKVWTAISYGALDMIDKSELENARERSFASALLEKVKFLSRIKVVAHPLARFQKTVPPALKSSVPGKAAPKIVAIAASTGGPHALLEILKALPADFASPILVVQHIVSGFVEGLAEWLDEQCRIKVKVGRDGEEVKGGTVYLAPSNFQMRLKAGNLIALSGEAGGKTHAPSADCLFESLAAARGAEVVGIILTGMGQDGALGLRAIKQKSGCTIAQDEGTCIVFGMPKAAIEMGIVDNVLALSHIAEEIVRVAG